MKLFQACFGRIPALAECCPDVAIPLPGFAPSIEQPSAVAAVPGAQREPPSPTAAPVPTPDPDVMGDAIGDGVPLEDAPSTDATNGFQQGGRRIETADPMPAVTTPRVDPNAVTRLHDQSDQPDAVAPRFTTTAEHAFYAVSGSPEGPAPMPAGWWSEPGSGVLQQLSEIDQEFLAPPGSSYAFAAPEPGALQPVLALDPIDLARRPQLATDLSPLDGLELEALMQHLSRRLRQKVRR